MIAYLHLKPLKKSWKGKQSHRTVTWTHLLQRMTISGCGTKAASGRKMLQTGGKSKEGTAAVFVSQPSFSQVWRKSTAEASIPSHGDRKITMNEKKQAGNSRQDHQYSCYTTSWPICSKDFWEPLDYSCISSWSLSSVKEVQATNLTWFGGLSPFKLEISIGDHVQEFNVMSLIKRLFILAKISKLLIANSCNSKSLCSLFSC